MARVRNYMQAQPESELHRRGKMFGVLVVAEPLGYLAAFSAMLDGSFTHDGFVPPVFDWSRSDGYFRQEETAISQINRQILSGDETVFREERKGRSQALQRWLFAQFGMLNAIGQSRNLLDIFAAEPAIMSREDYFAHHASSHHPITPLPPSGAGECCAPKLLQYAFLHGLKPVCMAEFWMGASPRDELRVEGQYYPACQGKCKPILRHMLQGLEVQESPRRTDSRARAKEVKFVIEDAHLLVVEKPSGLLSVPGKEDDYSLQDYLTDYLMAKVSEDSTSGTPVFAVHRLDQDTSGLMVFAKTKEAAKLLQQQFLRREVKKIYLAVVEPMRSLPSEGEIRLPLLPNPLDRPRQMVDLEHGKTAITRWRQLGEWQSNSAMDTERGWLLALYPETGRTHQLRVHLAHQDGLGCPIKGDRLYGIESTAHRLMLHAAELQFTHPTTGESMHFKSEPRW